MEFDRVAGGYQYEKSAVIVPGSDMILFTYTFLSHSSETSDIVVLLPGCSAVSDTELDDFLTVRMARVYFNRL